MMQANRRYDIDWVRVIAIGLLLIYHVAIGFQPWGIMIGFIGNTKTWTSLWVPMTMLNIWRIPLLFFVSGMGVYFALQNRNWKALIKERAARILIPFLFGMFVIFPISSIIWQYYNQLQISYDPNPGHLWFLGNIFIYVLVLSPAFYYLKTHETGNVVRLLRKALSTPLGLLPVVLIFIVEAWVIKPKPYELYAMTWHGFFLGMLAFFFGFCFVLSGTSFWQMLLKWRWMFLSTALLLFIIRLLHFKMNTPIYWLVLESDCWIFSMFAFANRYLNRTSKALSYLSEAAYPVYIMHMIFLYLGSMIIFPLDIDVHLQFFLVLFFTLTGCLGFYEFIIRRINFVRPLFGVKMK